MPKSHCSDAWLERRASTSHSMTQKYWASSGAVQRLSGSKYGNIKTKGYASKKEALRAQDLKLLEKAGKIWNLKEQEAFLLIPKQEGERACSYIADFTYWDAAGFHCEDVKSPATRKLPVYSIKRKLMLFLYEIRIEEL